LSFANISHSEPNLDVEQTSPPNPVPAALLAFRLRSRLAYWKQAGKMTGDVRKKTTTTMNEDYGKHFNDDDFWKKVSSVAKNAGREVIEKCLILYYCANDPKTPVWAKGVIAAALGYFIFPLDAIPDLTPFVGYADDMGAIVAATAALGASITKAHINSARKKAIEWFGPRKKK
jgi:uncharacterized membrane protein YkvA (DUF1232 family)